MKQEQVRPDWFDRLVAVLFATVVVLGVATTALALAIYFPGVDSRSGIPLPL